MSVKSLDRKKVIKLFCCGYIRVHSTKYVPKEIQLIIIAFIGYIQFHHGYSIRPPIRPYYECRHITESSFYVLNSHCTSGYHSLYALFKSHGGNKCLEFSANNLIPKLTKYLSKCTSVVNAFNMTISELDKEALEYSTDGSGASFCAVLIDYETLDLWCCNVGDAQCFLINKEYCAIEKLSTTHIPNDPLEKQRIENAGGWVTFNRVCGIFSLSRSLGDRDFKCEIENLIISTPDVTHHAIKKFNDKYIVMGCDNLKGKECMEWMKQNATNCNCMEVIDIVEEYMRYAKENGKRVCVECPFLISGEEPKEQYVLSPDGLGVLLIRIDCLHLDH